ncbi:MAG: heparan-alpha-glucosaminide N-acetyltransferase domain-containing protein [Bacteroidota bacterium]|nr:heparan-alpha-glucosaminide N-acetyltransferase domain-containing protein [Bacteroidota bacterium]
MLTADKYRVESIDTLRGIVMIIMALDHVRDYFHITANTDDPLNLLTTTPLLFLTRWITHFCAPVFVFLSGTSIYLQSLRKTKKELSLFLFKRGLWLIFLEIAIVTFGWSFNPMYNTIFLQVIWAIGISMIILGVLIHLPFKVMLFIGLAIVFGHNLLDIPESAQNFRAGFLWDLFHHGHFAPYALSEHHTILIIYPFVAWTGTMILGYCIGVWFQLDTPVMTRRKNLFLLGSILILIFIALRFTNIYGDPEDWTVQKNGLLSFFSFLDVNKYPPSLLFLCMTIGPALLALSWLELVKNRLTKILNIYGRVALFYYVAHIYVMHLFCVIAFFLRGHTLDEAYNPTSHFPFYFLIPGEGYSLGVVYLIWVFLILMLYPVCKWYDNYKTNHREKWWLSYL